MVSLLWGTAGIALGFFFGWLVHRERVERALYEDVVRHRDRATATLAETSARLELANRDMVRLRGQLTDSQRQLRERADTIAELRRPTQTDGTADADDEQPEETSEASSEPVVVDVIPAADADVDETDAASVSDLPTLDELGPDDELDADDITEEVPIQPAEPAGPGDPDPEPDLEHEPASASDQGGELESDPVPEPALEPVSASGLGGELESDPVPEPALEPVSASGLGGELESDPVPEPALEPVSASGLGGELESEPERGPAPAPDPAPEAVAQLELEEDAARPATAQPGVTADAPAGQLTTSGAPLDDAPSSAPAAVDSPPEEPAAAEIRAGADEPADADVGDAAVGDAADLGRAGNVEGPSGERPADAPLQLDTAEPPAAIDSATDDLQRISGIGPALERLLVAEGISTYRQLAVLGEVEVEVLGQRSPRLAARLRRDGWVAQARRLHVQTYGTPP